MVVNYIKTHDCCPHALSGTLLRFGNYVYVPRIYFNSLTTPLL